MENLAAIRSMIERHKRWDAAFAVFGLLCLMIGVLTFVTLFTEMAVNGASRREG